MSPLRLAVVIGTRPEAIKLAPIVLAAKAREEINLTVVSTGQHREMLDQMFDWFGIKPDVDLRLMVTGQSISHITSRALEGVEKVLLDVEPDWVLVQGDTTTSFAAALAAFYQKCKVGHVEAGLRTHHRYNPFPEEMNRCLTGRLADFHFPPTEAARDNLLREGVAPQDTVVTGNTSIDALLWTHARAHSEPAPGHRRILVTAHRRENLGEPLTRICAALLDLCRDRPDLDVVFPVHLNPRVRTTVEAMLGNHPQVRLIEPLAYADFVAAMAGSRLILSDSGGVQEEAPSLGVPVLVMRETTERPEGVQAGVSKLVGTSRERIVEEAARLIDDDAAHAAVARIANPYGDGQAADRILDAILERQGGGGDQADRTIDLRTVGVRV